MKMASKKAGAAKGTAQKSTAAAKTGPVAAVGKTGGSAAAASVTPIDKQPQSKLQAAQQAGVFLHTDDAWSLAYFNAGDLHCEERELFG